MSGAAATTPVAARTLGFDGVGFVPAATDAGDPRAATSWLALDGGVVAWWMHVERFAASVARQGGDARLALRAADAVPRAVPGEGAWFPRLDWRDDGARLLVRPAPARSRRIRLATAPHDPRTTPATKGPDLAALGALRARAQDAGADEAVVVVDGCIVDGATTAIAWWRGDVLHVPTDARARVASVTARQVEAIARARGVDVRREDATPASLEGAEVWALNALHGIRGVTAWAEEDGAHHALAAPDRADAWHAALEGLRRPWT